MSTSELAATIRAILNEVDAILLAGEDDDATEDAVKRLQHYLKEYTARGFDAHSLY